MTPMEHRSIIFFGDGSLSLHPALSQVLQAQKQGSLLAYFFNGARCVIQEEIAKLPAGQLEGVPNLSDLQNLTHKADGSIQDHQALAPAMLLLIQIGQFILYV